MISRARNAKKTADPRPISKNAKVTITNTSWGL